MITYIMQLNGFQFISSQTTLWAPAILSGHPKVGVDPTQLGMIGCWKINSKLDWTPVI